MVDSTDDKSGPDEAPDDSDDEALQELRDEIAFCIVHYGGKTKEEAIRIVREYETFWPKNPTARMMLFHETAYYWAMCRIYGNSEPLWYRRPGLWPPPADYYGLYEDAKKRGAW